MGASEQADTPGHRLAADGDRTARPAWCGWPLSRAAPPSRDASGGCWGWWRWPRFEMYDLYLFALTLKQIQADLAIPEAPSGSWARWCAGTPCRRCRAGGRPDSVDAVLLGTILAYTLFTGATACAPTAQVFVLLQFCARTFAVAETLLAVVVIAEEFDPDVRVGGLAPWERSRPAAPGSRPSCLWGSRLPWGWRSLYLVGLGPLLLLAAWRRTLPETVRFAAHQATRDPATSTLAPAGRARAAVPRPSWGRRGGGIHPRTGSRARGLLRAEISPGRAWVDPGALACSPSPEVPWAVGNTSLAGGVIGGPPARGAGLYPGEVGWTLPTIV